jgi:hypothetical protein
MVHNNRESLWVGGGGRRESQHRPRRPGQLHGEKGGDFFKQTMPKMLFAGIVCIKGEAPTPL